jgi:hypothetical protein
MQIVGVTCEVEVVVELVEKKEEVVEGDVEEKVVKEDEKEEKE